MADVAALCTCSSGTCADRTYDGCWVRRLARAHRAIRKPGGKWHRGGRYDYPGAVRCPVGLGLVLMPRNCETTYAVDTDPADRCKKCFGDVIDPTPAPETAQEAPR